MNIQEQEDMVWGFGEQTLFSVALNLNNFFSLNILCKTEKEDTYDRSHSVLMICNGILNWETFTSQPLFCKSPNEQSFCYQNFGYETLLCNV